MSLTQQAASLIAYDVADPQRLRRVHKMVAEHAFAVQYSLYLALGSQSHMSSLSHKLDALLDPKKDDVRIYRVPDDPQFYILGRHRTHLRLLLPGSISPGVRRFIHALCDPDPEPESEPDSTDEEFFVEAS
jgi:CRISPR-associated protein Cas2